MASHNLTLANTTSRLMAGQSANTTEPYSELAPPWSEVSGGSGVGSLRGLLDSGFGGGLRSVSAPGAAQGVDSAGESVQGGAGRNGNGNVPMQRAHSALPTVGGGAVMSPSQAREIGALLTRLTNENTQFLKARDAAVASRNEALNRAAALEGELELLQQQLR